MDRWGDGDGLDSGPKAPLTGVSKKGMGAFIKSSEGAALGAPEAAPAKIEVVASRREQKRAQMPPPPPVQPVRPPPQGPTPGAFRPPEWAGPPPSPARLDVLKDGHVIQSIPLQQPATVFGRSPAADVVLDHPSLSRQHAVVCYNRLSGEWVLLDLNSTHGTNADGKAVVLGEPTALKEGVVLRFAASSREYLLRQSSAASNEPRHSSAAPSTATKPPAKRKKGVQWPDEATEAAGQSVQQLEKVIGYSDGGSFASRVGPQPVDGTDTSSGRFADLVQSRVIAAKEKARQEERLREEEEAGERQQEEREQQQQPKFTLKRKLSEELQRRHLAQPFLKQSMYDFLPPPSHSSAQPS